MFDNFIKLRKQKGAIALLLVIMITSLTLISSVILSMANISDMLANYHFSEAANVNIDIDSCIDDALYRITSSSDVSGSFYISVTDVDCSYEIGATIAGIKYVTSTASSTSGIGAWSKTVVTMVNVSTSPISIESYKDSVVSFDSYILPFCGDGNIDLGETCDDGNNAAETQTCGNSIIEGGTSCNADCSAEIVLTETCDVGDTVDEGCGNNATEVAGDYCNGTCTGTTTIGVTEVCDDGNFTNEGCGNNVVESADTYCNSTCSATIVIGTSEVCDYTGAQCGGAPLSGYLDSSCAGKNPYCNPDCSFCISNCLM